MMGQAEIEALVKNIDQRTERIEQILPTLATRAYIDEKLDQTHTFIRVMTESIRDDIRLLAEGQVGLHHRIGEVRTELKSDIKGLDQRLTRVEAILLKRT